MGETKFFFWEIGISLLGNGASFWRSESYLFRKWRLFGEKRSSSLEKAKISLLENGAPF
ncbi:hypothetical protein JCM10003_3146 [Bacteroides pyogenes JCM 10003]|nr:hypothetical protein JCM10003_3146 [Bacteroides pyogenes JCM 10003]